MTSVTVVVPAHNEADVIAAAIAALQQQTRPPDRIVVASDNSTDDTVAIARHHGVDVFETVNNRHKKSGALNQCLDWVGAEDDAFILIVDADTQLSPEWIEVALRQFDNPEVGAVGGVFVGDGKNGLLGALQSVEYARYQRQIRRDYGKARVLTGTSTMARMGMFREVKRRRDSGEFPGRGYYNVDALTEDFSMTVAIKRLGYKTVSPRECTVVTETMPTLPMLWRQRTRWQYGALQTLQFHGLNRVTIPYALRQVEAGLGIIANVAILVLAAHSALIGSFEMVPFWLAIGVLFLAERIVSASEYGWKGVVIAATLVADLAFDLFISAVWIWCLVSMATRRNVGWGIQSIDTATKGA